ncbi:Protein of unknown function [Nitrosomonas aestuarii]|uniref:DUF3015 domain-containing protein n=1 Tax=Nitrosomonas aestuarii TaxID=52441 RepID=A0A1I4ETD2_9PROT|nr:DUF3015 domain-containing protein [Nitrosomonas aestuarii]SFL08370.1 Protein of unknown function [Nitrosomonas aestuarii]
MIRNSLVVFAVFLFLLPLSAGAAGYGTAGCGLGSMVIGSDRGAKQIFAATTNGTSGSQTFGMTSGTSNCGDHGLLNLSKEREVFASENYTSLVKEMAQGKGENLNILASMYQCPIANYQEFGAMTQDKFNELVAGAQTTPIELLSRLENQLSQHRALSKSCNIQLSVLKR